MSWLVLSIGLSLVLTVLLNVAVRVFPRARHRAARKVTNLAWPTADDARMRDRRVRVWVPWRAMILGSVMLTIVLNIALWIARD